MFSLVSRNRDKINKNHPQGIFSQNKDTERDREIERDRE